jgi:hypothetical protein
MCSVRVTFSGTQFERILTNEGNSVVMQHNDLADVAQWPLGVIMRYYIGLFSYTQTGPVSSQESQLSGIYMYLYRRFLFLRFFY